MTTIRLWSSLCKNVKLEKPVPLNCLAKHSPFALFTGFALFTSVAGVPALAADPDLKTPSPVIYLADNLDEKDNLGWCIDTVGRGLSDRLHAHSCKPRGGDVQFKFDAQTGQI
ncbi:MAG: hypothetical protein HRU27_04945, partial [Rhizobiaceae bacterium]|nr:hypothetical protein [Rhizobiaceae bacterium]